MQQTAAGLEQQKILTFPHTLIGNSCSMSKSSAGQARRQVGNGANLPISEEQLKAVLDGQLM